MTETTPARRQARYYHHGKSPAAWIGSAVALVGFLLGSVAFLIGPDWTLIWVSAGIVVASLVVTVALRALGFGQGG